LSEKWNSKKWITWWLYINYKQLIKLEYDWNIHTFNFYDKILQGKEIPVPEELIPLVNISFHYNTFLTEQYLKYNTNQKYIDYTINMADTLKVIFINRIKSNKWLSSTTKMKAIKKLEYLNVIVGSPSKLREDPDLDYVSDNPWYNTRILAEWRFNKMLLLEGKYSDIDIPEIDWNNMKFIGTQAYIVNAYYTPTSNSIYIPMGYLQKPFIDLDERGIEYNLAFLGYTLAHEFSHCLDDMGSRYDENGNLFNWWTDNDRKHFNLKVNDIIKQYETFALRDGIVFDASLGVGEDMADISGMSLVEEYLLLFQEKNEDIDIIKEISLNAFFTYIAIQSRQKIQNKALAVQLKINPHPLEKYRCNCPLSRLSLFNSMYNIKKGDGMWWHNKDMIW